MKKLHLNRAVAATVAAVMALVVGTAVYTASSSSAAATTTATKHYVANVGGHFAEAAALGYNVLDVSSVSVVNTLPEGTQAMFWLGSGQKCPTPIDSTFTTTVDRLVPLAAKVYAVYLSDEPESAGGTCPNGTTADSAGPGNIKARSDYVKSKLPGVKTFILIDNQQTFYPYRPAVTGVDLVGLDPYPFNVKSAPDYGKVAQRVSWATAGGWAKSQIVPTFQLFGQQCTTGGDFYYRFPTDTEIHALLDAWHAAGPFSELDYTYTWKNQMPNTSCPTLIDVPSAQQIMKSYFASATATPTPTVTVTHTATQTVTQPPVTTTATVTAPPVTTTATVTAPPVTTTATVTQPPVTTTETVTVAPPVRVSELSCALGSTHPAPGDQVTCSYR